MKITEIDLHAVRVNHRGDWIFIHVNTSEGIYGLGELCGSGDYGERVRILRELEGKLKGRDPRQIEDIIFELSHSYRSRNGAFAVSAIGQALWDILGKVLGVPVYTLLGGKCRDEIELYANINRATTERSPEGFASNAAAAVTEGFRAVKLAPFDGLPLEIDEVKDAESGVACVRAVREAIGPNVKLMVDCHDHFTVRGAMNLADTLEELNLYWLEQPIPESQHEDCLVFKRQCRMRLAGGENDLYRADFNRQFADKIYDVAMPDVTLVGGTGELKKIADTAAAWSIPVAPHAPFGPVSLAASLQAMAACPTFLIHEYAWGEVPWRGDLLLPRENIMGGKITLSAGPGLGVELNMEAVEAHRTNAE